MILNIIEDKPKIFVKNMKDLPSGVYTGTVSDHPAIVVVCNTAGSDTVAMYKYPNNNTSWFVAAPGAATKICNPKECEITRMDVKII